MGKLYFYYSAMGAGKSLDLIRTAYNYEEKGMSVLVLSPSIDKRYGENIVKSRAGLSRESISISKDVDIINRFDVGLYNCLLVDEVQFFSKNQIKQLYRISWYYDIPVICFGLRADFRLEPFEASAYLLSLADEIKELKTICKCGKKATISARIIDGKVVTSGDQILIGGNESYEAMCKDCFLTIIKKNKE